jgi:hypothetical protein
MVKRGFTFEHLPTGIVMRGLVPRIHEFLAASKDVDGRDERGHDGGLNLAGRFYAALTITVADAR